MHAQRPLLYTHADYPAADLSHIILCVCEQLEGSDMSARLRGLAWAFVALKKCAGSFIARANEGCAFRPSDQRHRCSLFRMYIKQQLLLDTRWLLVVIITTYLPASHDFYHRVNSAWSQVGPRVKPALGTRPGSTAYISSVTFLHCTQHLLQALWTLTGLLNWAVWSSRKFRQGRKGVLTTFFFYNKNVCTCTLFKIYFKLLDCGVHFMGDFAITTIMQWKL